MIWAAVLLASAAVTSPDRTHEGDWYVVDTTDNNTGEREVYAVRLLLNQQDYVTLTMRCSKGQPTFFVEWDKVAFPEVAVLSFGVITAEAGEQGPVRFVFDKSSDPIERGLRASPEVSQKIVSTIGAATYLGLTAHLTSGDRVVGMDVEGTQRAWSRVARHCPAPIMPLPPL